MLAQSTPTIIWYRPQKEVSGPVLQARYEELQAAGFELQLHTQPRDFYPAALQAIVNLHTSAPPLFMVAGVNSESLAAISRLRMHSVSLPIVVDFPSFSEDQVLQALYSGADDYFCLDNSAALWVAKIECLLRRVRYSEMSAVQSGFSDSTAIVEQLGLGWILIEEGWILTSPEGRSMSLTTTEREFLLALCEQSDRRASHQQLLHAISESEDGPESLDSPLGHNRLGVVISRLKRKGAVEGMNIPIRSIYKWGYMFGAPIRVQ